MSRRPDDAGPLSPAAQAVLENARESRWVSRPRLWIDAPDGLVAEVFGPRGEPYREAILEAVNAYPRDRELLAMARDVIQKLADAGTVAFHYDIARLTIQNRCLICDWPLHDKAEDGCTRDNCAYRTEDNTERVQLAARCERAAVVYAIEKAQQVLVALGTEA